MMNNGHEELSHAEREALGALPRELPPPRGLNDRVTRAVERQGLLRSHPRWRRVSAVLAAGIPFTLAGFGLGRLTMTDDVVPAGAQFLLLIYDGPSFDPGGRTEAELVEEYSAWAGQLARDGRLVSAEKLAAGGRVVDGPAVSPGPAPAAPPEGAPGELGGFFLIVAPDYAQAEAIARASPHVRYGGTIVVRRVEET